MTPLPARNRRLPSSRRSTMGAGRPQFDDHHGRQQHGPRGYRRQHLGIVPAQVGPFRDAVHQQPEAEPGQHEAGQVEAARLRLRRLVQEDRAEREGRDADRHVDVEHPPPRQLGDEQAAEHRPEGGRQRGGDGEDGRGPDALVGREHPVEHRHPDRGEHAAGGALEDPERDQLGQARGHAAQRGGPGEQRDGGEQDPLAAVPVAEPAGRRDEHGQADQERDGDPVHGGGAHPEVAADGRQRDVDDRHVHDAHEHGGDEDDADRCLLAHPRSHSLSQDHAGP